MIRTILSLAVVASLAATASLQAERPSRKITKSRNQTSKTTVTPAAPLTSGWSLANGVWTHSDGYKFVNGQVMRVGTQTHKKPPKPPTKAEMNAATKKPATKTGPAAAKTTEREQNLRQIPASQTGTHL
jgi:hypothetical protein